MKRDIILGVILLFIVISCSTDDPQSAQGTLIVPPELSINQPIGIKLESNFVTTEAKMNVKLEQTGTYTIKIVDIEGKVVSKETVNALAGDNLLTVYTKALPRSSYQLQLFNQYNQQIGVTVINLL